MLSVNVALAWILYLALFFMAFFWLRRAHRIFIQKDYSEVALKHGEGPANPEKWAPFTGFINLAAGAVAVWVILGVIVWIAFGWIIGPFRDFDAWIAIAGSTLWIKIFADFIVSRQAHPFVFGKKKKESGKSK
jgi:hypothetical protein